MAIIKFLLHDAKLGNVTMHVESAPSAYVCLPNEAVFKIDK